MHDSNPLDSYKILSIKVLKKERQDEVKRMLERAAEQVQPIMRKRQWSVALMSEFFPRNPNLLGLNVGGGGGRTREIRVRVRKAGAEQAMYPFEFVLGTVLHELTHNVHGPHNRSFYALLDEISEECERLMAEGISRTGVGFDGASSGRLGGQLCNPSACSMRDATRRAAEKRQMASRSMPPGGRRLGGVAEPMRQLTPAQAAARAAERRARDDTWCPAVNLIEPAASGAAAGGTAPSPAKETERGGCPPACDTQVSGGGSQSRMVVIVDDRLGSEGSSMNDVVVICSPEAPGDLHRHSAAHRDGLQNETDGGGTATAPGGASSADVLLSTAADARPLGSSGSVQDSHSKRITGAPGRQASCDGKKLIHALHPRPPAVPSLGSSSLGINSFCSKKPRKAAAVADASGAALSGRELAGIEVIDLTNDLTDE